ncbi:reverse transcriptase domain-containing protein [Tanacetum coccineum]
MPVRCATLTEYDHAYVVILILDTILTVSTEYKLKQLLMGFRPMYSGRGSRSRAQCFMDPYVAVIIRSRESFNEFTWYKNKVLHIRIAAYSDQARPNQIFVSTSWCYPWDPILGITLVRMSMMANATPIVTTVTKTTNKEKASDAAPRVNIQDFCEEHYEDILPIIMEKARRDKRKEVQTRLNFGENSKRSRRERENSLNSRAENLPARFHPERSRTRGRERRDDRNVFSRLSHRRKSVHERLSDTYSGPGRTDSREPSHSRGHSHVREPSQTEDRSRGTEESYGDTYSQGTTTNNGGHWKSRTKMCKLTDEDDLAEPWTCEDMDPFTPRIRNFKSSRKTRMPSNVKTYNGTGDPEDHLKIFQAAAQVERWAMPTWCHMFNSTLIGAERVWFDELPQESIDGYKGLKAAFLTYFMQQKKYVKDLVEIHNIKQREGETIEDFMERFKVETGEVAAALKRKVTYRGNHKTIPSGRPLSENLTSRSQPREGRGSSRFTPLIKTPKEILATEAGKFKPPLPMVTPVEKRSSNKFYDFYNDKGHSTDECMQLKKQIEELVRAGKLSHLIKEIKQGQDQIKNGKKEAPTKDKSLAIYMIRQWQRTTRQKLTQSFAYGSEIMFPPLADSDGTEGPLVIEAEIGGHMIHRIYIDEGSSTKILYEHCFNQLHPEIRSQMVPVRTSLTSFSGETIWPLRQLRLLMTTGDADHYTKVWMNFMIVRSISQYNSIIGRPGIREIQAVPSTAHEMLKFPADGGIVTIRSTILIPAECATVITSPKEIPKEAGTSHQNLKVAIHLNFPDQEVAIGGTLSLAGRTELCTLLKKNLDIFTWQPSDMTGVPRSIAEHWLNIREGYSLVRQKKMGQAPERAKAI